MKKILLFSILLISVFVSKSQEKEAYKPLDANDPIVFGGEYIIYKSHKIFLGPHAFFIDGQLTSSQTAKYPFVFSSINEAAKHLTDGTETSPMTLYVAPHVYWIDNPDDPAERVGKNGEPPYGLTIKCEWLRFYGLSEKAENVVLAANRGQTIGAKGNFTLFKFIGQGTSSENITFGNYCNIDLEFPLKPELNRKKRASAIVQAQLIHCNGDKIVARNTHFVSRLNLCPFVGGKRILFDRCHFESTDDALSGTGVYLNCTFEFYSSMPFYRTTGTGVVFLNSDITSYTVGDQYFTKADNGQLALIDTRVVSKTLTYIGWQDVSTHEMRNYQYNVSLNKNPVFVSEKHPSFTVDLANEPLLDAYRFEHEGKVFYNTYNLLRGDDDWDPMNMKELVLKAEEGQSGKFTQVPIQLLISPAKAEAETGKDTLKLSATVNRFGDFKVTGKLVKWSIDKEDGSLLKLLPNDDGSVCTLIPTNYTDETKRVIVTARTASGLEAASSIQVAPSKLDPPKFISTPKLQLNERGTLSIKYKTDTRYEDQSLVTWYRCFDAKGNNPVEVAVSRFNKPLLEYVLTAGDIGHYVMASVAPRDQRSDAGGAIKAVTTKAVMSEDIKTNVKILDTDFKNMSTKDQPLVKPGFWTLYSFRSHNIDKARSDKDAWYYGEGSGGSAGYIGLLQNQFARLFYTPVGKGFGDMKMTLTVVPSKTAGQGFSVAPLYMDFLIKFDAKTLTGYGLRFIRTTKYHDAVDCYFVKYENGKASRIGELVSTSAFRPACDITLEVKGNRLIAHAKTEEERFVSSDGKVVAEVNMDAHLTPGTFGGFGIEYAGGAAVLIKNIRVEWK
jgi:hypothetical protein